MNTSETMDKEKVLPSWKCHKTVRAAKIVTVEPLVGRTMLHLDGGAPTIQVSDEYMAKHSPKPGGYYINYDDGYESFSPAKAFEDGYDLIS